MRIPFTRFHILREDTRNHSGSSDNFLKGNWDVFSIGTKSKSGIRITSDNAMNLSGVYSAVSVYTNAVLSLPIPTLRTTDTLKIRENSHPVAQLMREPNALMTHSTWIQIIIPQILLWGNSFNLIEFEKGGSFRPIAIMPIHPNSVEKIEIVNGVLVYHISLEDGTKIVADQTQMLHFRGKGDNIMGKSVIDYARDNLGLGQATEDFGNSFYANSASSSGVLTHPGSLTQKAQDNISDSWDKKHKGVNKSNKTSILEEGMKYQQITIPPDASQFLETRRFSIEDIARWFTLPPDKIGDLTHATFSNLTQQDLNFVKQSVLPFVISIEEEINRKLYREQEKQTLKSKFNLEGLLRGDIKTRTEAYKNLFAVGGISPNEIRALEEMNPYDGGDSKFVQLNSAPVNEEGTNQPEKEEVEEEETEETEQLT